MARTRPVEPDADPDKKKRKEQLRKAAAKYYEGHKEQIAQVRLHKLIDDHKSVSQLALDKHAPELANYDKVIKLQLDKELESLAAKNLAKYGGKKNRTAASNGKVTLDELLDGLRDNVENQGTRNIQIRNWGKIAVYCNLDLNDITKGLLDVAKVEKQLLDGMIKSGLKTRNPKDLLNTIAYPCMDKPGRHFNQTYCDNLADVIATYLERMKFWLKENTTEVRDKTETEEVIDWKILQKAEKTIAKKFPNSQNHLIVALYIELPIRDDFGEVKIINGDPPKDKKNYWDIDSSTFYLRKYKTATKYGPKKYKMSKKLNNIIKHLHDEDDRDYIIVKESGGIYTGGKLGSKNISDAFDEGGVKGVSVNIIRHSRVANLLNNPKSTNSQKQDLADRMLHDIATQQFIYTRKAVDD